MCVQRWLGLCSELDWMFVTYAEYKLDYLVLNDTVLSLTITQRYIVWCGTLAFLSDSVSCFNCGTHSNFEESFILGFGRKKPQEWKQISYKPKRVRKQISHLLAAVWTCGIYSVLTFLSFHPLELFYCLILF